MLIQTVYINSLQNLEQEETMKLLKHIETNDIQKPPSINLLKAGLQSLTRSLLSLSLIAGVSLSAVELLADTKPAVALPARRTAIQWIDYFNNFYGYEAVSVLRNDPYIVARNSETLGGFIFVDENGETIRYPGQTVYRIIFAALILDFSKHGKVAQDILGESGTSDTYNESLIPTWSDFIDYVNTDWRGEATCSATVQLNQSLGASLCINSEGSYYATFF
ncbi:hypothetical protein HJG54_32060 [Leptolyngbya sp. NK1-12]|uniref:Uncharacterized protein n=1 Tax=Leptolyngbya sp. NK1-12 TaxID=2547451 RepID=A0AA97AP50_9CYAN|nr:hypothetical protein [Leptolyngbya sp. NK1-12]WNZ27512.1 hypothetical protein HJG54_32060 [Leptolyngbya sp. NK1-12]